NSTTWAVSERGSARRCRRLPAVGLSPAYSLTSPPRWIRRASLSASPVPPRPPPELTPRDLSAYMTSRVAASSARHVTARVATAAVGEGDTVISQTDRDICMSPWEGPGDSPGAVAPPIFQTSLFAKPTFAEYARQQAAEHRNFVYSR